MPTTDDGQGIAPLQQKGEHMGNSRYGGANNMNDKDYSKIGGHMSAGHLDSLKDIYGQARREQLYNPVVEDATLAMKQDALYQTGQKTYNKDGRMMTDTSDGATMSRKGGMYEHSDAYNEDFKNGIGAGMNSLALNSQERHDEYNRRGWAHDDSSELRTGTMTEDAIMYDEYPGPNAPATKKKTDVGNVQAPGEDGSILPTSEDDPRYKN